MSRMESTMSTSISFALTNSIESNGHHVIVLHLYRGLVPVAVKTIADVEPSKAAPLLLQCRRHLETLGVESIAHKIQREPRLLAASLSKARVSQTLVSLRLG